MLDLPKNIAKKTASSIADAAYTVGRKIGWLAYIGLPAHIYHKSKEGLDWVDSFAWYNPVGWAVNLYGWLSGKIADGELMNERAEKGLGVSSALLGTKLINMGTEKLIPKSHNFRRLVESGLYGTAAIGTNIVANSPEIKKSLEGLVETFSSEEALADTITRTVEQAGDTLYKIFEFTDNSITDNTLLTASAALGAMALYRISEIIFPNPVTKLRDKYVEDQALIRESRKP